MSLHDWAAAVAKAGERHHGQDIDRALEELGWPDALAAEPRIAIPAVFTAIGFHVCTSSALGDVVAHSLSGSVAAAVLPPPGQSRPPGQTGQEGIAVAGIVLGRRRGPLVIGTESSAVIVDGSHLDLEAVSGWDPDAEMASTGAGPTLSPYRELEADWTYALSMGRLAASYSMIGCGRAMLALAREHALSRQQFGRPIATFQAVRHRLAETLVWLEGAEALLDAVWEEPIAGAAAAKAFAGRAVRGAARHCQQVLAGVGFTKEQGFHRYLRRSLLLDQLLGSSKSLTIQLGGDLITSGRVPVKLDL